MLRFETVTVPEVLDVKDTLRETVSFVLNDMDVLGQMV